MTSPRLALALALAALAATAAPAAADPVPLLASRSAQSVAVAGTDVVVARRAAGGSATVDALPTQGGPARRLLAAPRLGKRWSANAFLAASPQRVAVVVDAFHRGRHEVIDNGHWRVFTGPVAGPLTLALEGGLDDLSPLDVAVDGDRVFLSARNDGSNASRGVVLAPGAAAHVLPWRGDVESPIAIAGNHAAFIGTAASATEEPDEKLFVVDPATGAIQSTVETDGGATEFDLAPDGHVVAVGNHGLFTAGAGRPRAALPGGEDMAFPRFAGAAVAGFEAGDFGAQAPAVVDPGAGRARRIGVPTFEPTEIDADANGVAWIAHGCVLYAPLGSLAPAEPPAGPCPRSEAEVDSFDDVMAHRRVRFEVLCVAAPAAGCRGQVTLRLRHKVAGRARFHAASGRRHRFTVRLSKRAARFVRRRVHHGDRVLVNMKARVRDGGPPTTGSILVDRVRDA